MSRLKRLPTDFDKLAVLIERFSDREPRLGYAAEAILAEYYVPRSMCYQLAKNWLIEEIDRHRHPDAYKEEEEEEGIVISIPTRWSEDDDKP